jgi:hypothetical protein
LKKKLGKIIQVFDIFKGDYENLKTLEKSKKYPKLRKLFVFLSEFQCFIFEKCIKLKYFVYFLNFERISKKKCTFS